MKLVDMGISQPYDGGCPWDDDTLNDIKLPTNG